jgi:hypothetical protein
MSLQMRQPQSDAGSDTDDSFRGDLAAIARAVNTLCSDLASNEAASMSTTPYSKPAGSVRVTGILKTPMILASPAGQAEAATTVARDNSKQAVRNSICFTTPGVATEHEQDEQTTEHEKELTELRFEVAALRKACQHSDEELLKVKQSAAYQSEQQSTIAQLRSEAAAARVEQAVLEHESSELKQRLQAATQQLTEAHDALQTSEASRHRAEGALQHLAQELEHIKHELEAQAVAAVEGTNTDSTTQQQQQQYKALIAAHQTELQRATAAAEHSAADAAAAARSLAAAKQQTAALEAALQCRDEELRELRALAATVTARCSTDSNGNGNGGSTTAVNASSGGVARALLGAAPSTPGGHSNGGYANGCADTTPSSDWESVRSNWRSGGAALSRSGSDAAVVSELAAELAKLKQELSEARSKLDALGEGALNNSATASTAAAATVQDSYKLAGVRYDSSNSSSGISNRQGVELRELSLKLQRSEDERRALSDTLAAVRSAADAAQRTTAHTEQLLQQRLNEAQQQLSDVRADMSNMMFLRNNNSSAVNSGSGSSTTAAAVAAAQNVELLEAELHRAKAAMRDALQQLALAQQQTRSLQQAEAALQRSLKQCEQSAQTAAAAAQADYSRVRQRLESAEQQLASLLTQADAAADRCSSAAADAAAEQRELDSAQQRAQQLSEQLQTAAAQHDTALHKLADANECVTAEQRQSTALRTEKRSLLAQLDTVQRELRQAHSSSAERLAAAEAEISTLTAQLQASIAEESRLSAVLQTRAATWTHTSAAAAVIAPCSGDRVGKTNDDVLQQQHQQQEQQQQQQQQQQHLLEEACAGLEWVISALLATAAATSSTTASATAFGTSISTSGDVDSLMTQLTDVVKRVRAAAVHGTDSWRKLRTALAADVTALKAANTVLEQQVAVTTASIDSMQQQHSEKVESLLREQRASAVELATAKSELQQLQTAAAAAAASHRATGTPDSGVVDNNNFITNSSIDASYAAAESPSQCLLANLRASADSTAAATDGVASAQELRLRHGLVPVQWLAEAKAHAQQLQLQVRALEQQVTSAASSVPRSTVHADDSSTTAAADVASSTSSSAAAAHCEAELRVQIRGLQCELQSAVTAQHDAADTVQQLEQQVAELTAAAATASSSKAVAHSSAVDRELSHVRGELERVRAKYKAAVDDSTAVQHALTAYRRDVAAAAAALKSTLDVLMCMSSGDDVQQAAAAAAAAAAVASTSGSDCSAVEDGSNAVRAAAAEVAGLKDMSEAVYDMLRRVNSNYLQLQQQQQAVAEVTDDRPQLHDHHSSFEDSVLNDSTASSDLLDKSCAVAEALEEVCGALYTLH